MRLHRLEMTAFGPFAGTERIDFDALAEHGLFLLNGPTGAGKTSILVLEFTAQGRRFEVRRTPEWSKPSRRASGGWSVQKASTHLREHVDGDWTARSARNDEAGAVLTDVLGMGREQFTRVVMLPQGEFASFLRSKAAERVALLEKLFGTQRYADVEEQLAQLAQAARGEAEQAERAAALPLAQLEAELAATHEAPHDALPGQTEAAEAQHPTPVEAGAGRALFKAAERAFEDQSAAAARAQAQAKADLEAAREAAAAATRLLEDGEELVRARERRAAWKAAAPEHTRRLSALAAHRDALGLRAHLAESERSAADEVQARREALAALDDALAAGWDPGSAPDTHSLPAAVDVRHAAAAASAEAAVLAERLPAEHELEELETRLDGGAAESRRLATACSRAEQELETASAETEGLSASRARLEPVAAGLALARVEAESAQTVMDAVQDHADAAPAAAAAAEAHTRLRQEALDARERWLALRERRLDQSAAELAARLEPGDPCPVCGSGEHPQPARGAEDPLGLVDAERGRGRRCPGARRPGGARRCSGKARCSGRARWCNRPRQGGQDPRGGAGRALAGRGGIGRARQRHGRA